MDVGELITRSLPVISVITGAVITYLFTAHRGERERIDKLFNQAIAAVAMLQAARHYVSGVERIQGLRLNPAQREEFEIELRKEGVRRFDKRATECREALASVYPYCPAVWTYVERYEISEDEAHAVIVLLQTCQKASRPPLIRKPTRTPKS